VESDPVNVSPVVRHSNIVAEQVLTCQQAKAAKKAETEKAEKEEREKKEKEEAEKKEKEDKEKKEKGDKEKKEKEDLKEVATATDKLAESETKAEAPTKPPVEAITPATDESKATEDTLATSDSKPASATTADKPTETKKDESSPATDKPKESEVKKETLAPAPEIFLNGSAPPSLAGFSDVDDDDDLSEIESVISDISNGVVDDAIAEAKLAAENAPAPPTNDDEEDEYEKDPWNAIAVVGLRVYCKGGEVGVKAVRPRLTEEEVLGKKKEGSDTSSEAGLGDSKLDVDDSAKDATKDVEGAIEKAEEAVKKEESEKKDVEGSQKGEHDSEGSVVMV
jgi:hypothetical protein